MTIAVDFVPVDDLAPYGRNARKHTPEAVNRLVAIIEDMGWTNPILADEDGIVAGHKRRLAALAIYAKGGTIRMAGGGGDVPAGMVPVLDVSGWTEAQRRAYIIADNQTTLESEWDGEVLRLELSWLKDEGEVDMALTGFDGQALAKALGLTTTEGAHAGEEAYTRKIKAPIYEPKGDRPAPAELYDETKTRELVEEIRAADLPEDIAAFLERAAERHTVFNFARIADFYASADAGTQRLMERSALVIIDFGQAIENGFVRLTKQLGALASGSPLSGVEEDDEG